MWTSLGTIILFTAQSPKARDPNRCGPALSITLLQRQDGPPHGPELPVVFLECQRSTLPLKSERVLRTQLDTGTQAAPSVNLDWRAAQSLGGHSLFGSLRPPSGSDIQDFRGSGESDRIGLHAPLEREFFF